MLSERSASAESQLSLRMSLCVSELVPAAGRQ